jgi:hypothetical protein
VRSYGAIVPSFYGLWGFAVAGAGLADRSAVELRERILRSGAERGVKPPATGLEALANTFCFPALLAARICP